MRSTTSDEEFVGELAQAVLPAWDELMRLQTLREEEKLKSAMRSVLSDQRIPADRPQHSRAKWLTPAEAAERLGVSVETVRRAIGAGKLGAANVANDRRRAYRIAHDELERFVRERHLTKRVPQRPRRRRRVDSEVIEFF